MSAPDLISATEPMSPAGAPSAPTKVRPQTWSRLRLRSATKQDPNAPDRYCLASERDRREFETSPAARITWPVGCDQCHRAIAPGPAQGARTFSVSRGQSPTTLYICGTCVGNLCLAGGIAPPNSSA